MLSFPGAAGALFFSTLVLAATPTAAAPASPAPGARPPAPATVAMAGPPTVLGGVDFHTVKSGESLIELARSHGLGFGEIAAANPGLDPFVPKEGSLAILPTAFVLPRAAARGRLVVNLSELRLYYWPLEAPEPVSYPVGVGTGDHPTPAGRFTVVKKQANPVWYPPASVRREEPELPAAIPPGPDNPLGSHALRLSRGLLLIHGTNEPWGVGREVSHGCLRLYPEDIPRLFEQVPVGTRVELVREAVKVGERSGRVYLEVHPDGRPRHALAAEARRLLRRPGLSERADPGKVSRALREGRGWPADVTRDPAGFARYFGRR